MNLKPKPYAPPSTVSRGPIQGVARLEVIQRRGGTGALSGVTGYHFVLAFLP
jgi:hypothetical protein